MTTTQSQINVFGSTLKISPVEIQLAPDECEETPDHVVFPLETDAYQYWKEFRFYVPFAKIKILAKNLGRQIRLDEIQTIVGKDGSLVECFASGKTFQPVFWVEFFLDFQKSIEQTKDVVKAMKFLDQVGKVIRFGHFFILKGGLSGDSVAVSGHPYFVDKFGDYNPDKKSPLVKAARKNAVRMNSKKTILWGLSLLEIQNRQNRIKKNAEELEAERMRYKQQEKENQRRIDQNIDDMFG